MQSKKIFLTISAVVLISNLTATAVLAEGNENSSSGFFANFGHMIGQIFKNGNVSGQRGSYIPTTSKGSATAVPMGTMMPTEGTTGGKLPTNMPAKEFPDMLGGQNLTDAQKQQILTEVQKLQGEVNDWSKSTGINPVFLYQGLIMTGMKNMMPQDQKNPQGWPDRKFSPRPNGIMPPQK